jgi:hypothetical protein
MPNDSPDSSAEPTERHTTQLQMARSWGGLFVYIVLDELAPEAHQDELEQLRAQSRHVFLKGAGSMQHLTVPPLGAQRLFQHASDAIVAQAARTVRYRTFKAHDIVSRQGDRNSLLILVISGQLQAFRGSEDGREIGINLIGPGESCGHCAIIQDTPAVSSIAAVTSAVVGMIGRTEARNLFRAAGVSEALLDILCTREPGDSASGGVGAAWRVRTRLCGS